MQAGALPVSQPPAPTGTAVTGDGDQRTTRGRVRRFAQAWNQDRGGRSGGGRLDGGLSRPATWLLASGGLNLVS